MRKIKHALWALAGVGVASSALAEGTFTLDTTAASTAASAIGTGLSTLITGSVLTNVLTVIGAALAIWAVFLVVRWMKKGAK